MKTFNLTKPICALLTCGALISASMADAEVKLSQTSITSAELQRRLTVCLTAEEWLKTACLNALSNANLLTDESLNKDEDAAKISGMDAPAKDIELHMIGIYEARPMRMSDGQVRRGVVPVTVDRRGSTVVLALTSYEAVQWSVTATPGTRIERIILGGYDRNRSEVTLDGDVVSADWIDDMGFSYREEGPRFQRYIEGAVDAAGVGHAASFQGDYAAPLEGFAITTAPGVLTPKEIMDQALEKARDRSSLPASIQAILNGEVPAAAANWRFDENGFTGVDANGMVVAYTMPADLPRVSWSGGVAYDSEGQRLWGVSFGGEGFLYEYDIANNRWSAKSMDNKDAAGLIYDPEGKRLIGTPGTLPGSPYFLFNDQANLVLTFNVSLGDYPGLNQYFDAGNGPSPALLPVAISGDKVLVRPDFGHARFGQTIPPLLYLVDIGNGTVELVGN